MIVRSLPATAGVLLLFAAGVLLGTGGLLGTLLATAPRRAPQAGAR